MILDTTIIIDFLRGKKEAVEFLATHPEKELYTTHINVFEILVGLYRRSHQEKQVSAAQSLFNKLNVLALNEAAVEHAARIQAKLLKKGAAIEETDSLIAGIALSHNITTIATNNKAHFGRIEEIVVKTY